MKLIWSIKDLVEICKGRQNNKFDVVIAVSGARGNGKSTFLYKLFSRFDVFRPWKHIVYSRNDVMALIEGSQYECILDDEAIRTGYKRNFYDSDQKLLIQILNMYRDNFNIYGLAIPNFYSLDKDLRDLVKIHIHVIERGLAVLHLPNTENLYSDDMWDVSYNRKIESKWSKNKLKKPGFSPPYQKLSTFRGYVEFGDLTPNQRILYEKIKKTKRKVIYDREMKKDDNPEETIQNKIMERLLEKKLTKETLLEICLVNGLRYRSVRDQLNRTLTERGKDERVADLLQEQSTFVHNNVKGLNNISEEKLKVI